MAIAIINDDYSMRHTICDLQDKIGIINNNHGIVYEAVQGTPLADLISDYIELADNDLYFNHTNRLLLNRYSENLDVDNLTLVKKAVYYSLASNEYNLKTLINSTKLEYDPIKNHTVHEEVSMSGQNTNTKEYGESVSISKHDVGAGKVTDTTTDDGMREVVNSNIGSQSDTNTTKIGARSQSSNSENTTSPYNIADYVPDNKNVTTVSDNEATDTINTTKGARTDSQTTETDPHTITKTSENTAKTDTDTTTRNPYTDTSTDKNSGSTTRDISGLNGTWQVTAQYLIEQERNLANLNITNYISTIVVSTICEGVLYDC